MKQLYKTIGRYIYIFSFPNLVKTRGHLEFQITTKNKGSKGCCGRDCMVVGFTTTCAISAYHY